MPHTCSHSLHWYEYNILRQYVENSWEFKNQSVAEKHSQEFFPVALWPKKFRLVRQSEGPHGTKPISPEEGMSMCVASGAANVWADVRARNQTAIFSAESWKTSLGRRGFQCSFPVSAAAWFWPEAVSTSLPGTSHTAGNLSQVSPENMREKEFQLLSKIYCTPKSKDLEKQPYCLRSAVAQKIKENKLSENKFRTEIVFLKPWKVSLCPSFKRCSESDIPAKFKPELFESEQNKTSQVSQQADVMTPLATLVLSPMLKNVRRYSSFANSGHYSSSNHVFMSQHTEL